MIMGMDERVKRNLYQRAYRNGMSVDQFLAFMEAHAWQCGICGKDWNESVHGGGLVLDHDHTCCGSQDPQQAVKDRPKRLCGACHRGLLCIACNAAIGQFGDRIDLLEAAILYLKRPRVILPEATGKTGPVGEQHGMSKLDARKVAEIRATHALGNITFKKLGEMYDVSANTISNVVNYRNWK
jgi:hypothetical protein